MNRQRFTTSVSMACGVLMFMMSGCTGDGSSGSSNVALPEVDVDVPSQAEADAEAAKTITADNADQALKDLESELEQEGGG